MRKFLVTAVDSGSTCNGKADLIACCDSYDEAVEYMRSDMQDWADQRAGMPIVVDFDKMSARYDWKTLDDSDGCEWNIHEISIDSSMNVLINP